MILPQDLQEKINKLYVGLNKKDLVDIQKQVTDKYKNQTGQSKSLIENRNEGLLYAISRMPATYSVIHSLVSGLIEQGLLVDVKTILDAGAGTGAGYFALKDIDDFDITLVEREKNMIDVFKSLTDNAVQVEKADILKYDTNKQFDMVVSSYVVSEMTENDRMIAVKKLLDMSSNYLLLIDTGTPRTYENMMKVKKLVTDMGFCVVAPCMCEKCGLVNDYCQFYARVERSSLHKLAKAGALSYEDEKYFYLLIKKQKIAVNKQRVIRRPVIKENNIELVLCTENGVKTENFTKKNKEAFKRAKKVKINGIM